MDSLTQIVLGSTIAALVTPNHHQRSALLAGAVLGTLPDLDTIWFNLVRSDAITTVTWHRGPSHSLMVLAISGWLLWLLLKRFNTPVRESPRSWLWAIWLALLTHPLLDAFTVYGTQLLWPLQTPPVMWATIFIIDPLYTIPLLVGVIAAWFISKQDIQRRINDSRNHLLARKWLTAGLILSSLYLSWSVTAKFWINQIVTHNLVPMGLEHAPRFSTPTPFNTFLWRVIVMTSDGYYVGDRSLIVDRGAMSFKFYPSDQKALKQLSSTPELQRLLWFTHGFAAAQVKQQDDGEPRLIISDLRMGLEPNYFFRFEIARQNEQNNWTLIFPITQVPDSTNHVKTLSWVWHRLWNSVPLPLP